MIKIDNLEDYLVKEKEINLPSGLKIKVKPVSILNLLEICEIEDIDPTEIANNPRLWQKPSFLKQLIQYYIIEPKLDINKLQNKDLLFLIEEVSKSFQTS